MTLDPGYSDRCSAGPHVSPVPAENDVLVQRVAEHGRRFSQDFTTRKARLQYWQAALVGYTKLFKDYNDNLNYTEYLGAEQ